MKQASAGASLDQIAAELQAALVPHDPDVGRHRVLDQVFEEHFQQEPASATGDPDVDSPAALMR